MFFDTNKVNGVPFGDVLIEGKEIPLGVCRKELGLILGERRATDPCLQPEGTFQSVEPNETTTIPLNISPVIHESTVYQEYHAVDDFSD